MRLFRTLVILVILLLALPYALVPLYGVGHPVSTLMLARWFTGQTVTREWVDLADMAPVLPLTVISSEDAKFCSHNGIDWDAVQEVLDDAQDGDFARGGSTITQQVAKNLFLWGGRSIIRKGLEFPLALWIDLILPKRRVLEIYLNIAEWGPDGQFGAEAGARHAFGRSARSLSPHEAALMAAVLPNPVTRSARNPGPGVRRIAARYVARARGAPEIAACLRPGFRPGSGKSGR
ncbi:peptidoglycan transglycosylase [Afipia sp. P52-10]|nr:peptidoglycan transglycosylase [Afipia sp. P52-10]